MNAGTASTSATPADLDPPWSPITVPMFEAMLRAGIVGEKEPVYLWKGRLARKMAPNRDHSIAVYEAARAIDRLLPAGYHLMAEQPLARRREASVPEPDLTILRGGPRDYRPGLPTTGDAPLIVEVSGTSPAADRAQEVDYAREGVPIYWVVNLRDRRIEVFDRPGPDGYSRATLHPEGGTIPVIVDGIDCGELEVRRLLP